jgi:starch phosphorylase
MWIYKKRWRRVYSEKLVKLNKRAARNAFMQVLGIDEKTLSPLLDDRNSGMTYSALGKAASPDLKNPWDPDQKKRSAIVQKLKPLLPGLELRIGGTTSIDITNAGIDKAYGVNKIIEYTKTPKDSVVFVGDALFPDGNDNPVRSTGIHVLETRGPENTREIIRDFLRAPETIEASSIRADYTTGPVAFFCAEYALDDDSLTYAGGLGVLAADYLYEARDARFPLVCTGLWYGTEKSLSHKKEYPYVTRDGKPIVIEIPFDNSTVKAYARARRFREGVWLILLDTDIEENSAEDKLILSRIYSIDTRTRIKQDVVLGLGGARVLDALLISPSVYHLNEGHAAFAAFELIVKSGTFSRKSLREKIVATKHTILSEAGAKIDEKDFFRFFGGYCQSRGISAEEIFSIGAITAGPGSVAGSADPEARVFSATHFLLSIAGNQNAVSKIHAKFERVIHPESKLTAITNGVYARRWRDYRWGNEVKKLTDDEIWNVKSSLRKELVDYTNAKTGSTLDPQACTVVWARRLVSYKRAELIISDLARLEKICSGARPLQFIISGNVYNNDAHAAMVLEQIRALAQDPKWKNKIAYLPGYSISLAHKLVSGADVWLNTPLRGKEACGTSGMKAGLNGGLQMSSSDGWIEEVNWRKNGWILPEEHTVEAIYDFLEGEVTSLFYEKNTNGVPRKWVKRMRKTVSIVERGFTARRMLNDYVRKIYKI